MNEMLRGLGFGQVTNTKWTNGENMMINVRPVTLDLLCLGVISHGVEMKFSVPYTGLETMKRHVEKFMRMVGKCIQVDEE